jgi:AraC-like DNA-binding protein
VLVSSAIRILHGRFGRVALLDIDGPLVTHAHHHCHLLIKVSGADTRFFTLRGARQPITDGNALLVNAWEPHGYSHPGVGGLRTVVLALYIECSWLAGLHRQLAVSSHPHFFPDACVRLTPGMRKLADNLAIEMLCDTGIPAERLESDLAELSMAVLDPFSEWHNAARLFRAGIAPSQDPRIRRAIQFMREHVGENIDTDALAAESHLSRAHFFALFRRSTGLTPALYANVLRMEGAIDAMSGSPTAVTEVAYRLGFSAPGHFTRFFRQHLGITPTDYRHKANVAGGPSGPPNHSRSGCSPHAIVRPARSSAR